MEQIKYLIIGGGVAGTTAADAIRKEDSESRIAIISDEKHPLYSRILLTKPNFFLGKIPFERIWLKKESWYTENNIEYITGKKAVRLDPKQKIITLEDETQYHYDKLLLAIGGSPRKLEVPGIDKKGIFYLRTVEDAQGIMQTTKTAHHGVSLGGGFIGFESANMMLQAELKVNYIFRKAHYQEDILGEEVSHKIEHAMQEAGITLVPNNEIVEIHGNESIEAVELRDGQQIPCDLLTVGIGIVCPHEWLEGSGVTVNCGVVTNEYLETNQPDIWSAGDGTEFDDAILCEREVFGNWVNSQFQGRTAAMNMLGKKEKYSKVSFLNTHGFGFSIGFVGDIRPKEGREVVERGTPDNEPYTRLVTRDKHVIGAILINGSQEMGEITQLIEKQIDISENKENLKNPQFDLKSLIP